MEKCYYCDYQTESKIKFAKHVLHTHKQNRQEYLIQTQHNGIQPTCKCGCGELMKYNATLSDFPTYNKKHLKKINEGKTFEEIWGDPKSEKRVSAIKNTRKERFASGEYDYIREAVRENRKNPDLGKKISEGAKGVPKPKPEGFGIGRIHPEETIEKMRDSAIQRIIKTDQQHTSNLEIKFKEILEGFKIKYQRFFYAKPIKSFYDFYLPEYNILIEVDGDFWHCNPSTHLPQYESQKKNIKKDQIKNEWAKENGYKILRFWEYDINNNLEDVKKILIKNLK
jgi:very-short-patch-repair endonuclease